MSEHKRAQIDASKGAPIVMEFRADQITEEAKKTQRYQNFIKGVRDKAVEHGGTDGEEFSLMLLGLVDHAFNIGANAALEIFMEQLTDSMETQRQLRKMLEAGGQPQ